MRIRLLLLAVLLVAVPAVRAQDETSYGAAPADERRRLAIRRALDYLAAHQAQDGSWNVRKNAGVVGITSLCLLAFMAQGHQEGLGRYGTGDRDVIRKGVNFLLARSLPPSAANPLVSDVRNLPVGYIYHQLDGDSNMHGHGYATQALVLAYGSGRAKAFPGLKEKIHLAIRVIEDSQTITGGWGYEPRRGAGNHEGSITVTVVQALRLARDAGFVVDREVHRRGLEYLKGSQKKNGAFKYSLMSDQSTAALTAAALCAMHGFGEYYSPAVKEGLRYIRERYDTPRDLQWPFYAHYYAAQAFYRAGGEDWRFWQRAMIPFILGRQSSDGSWSDELFSGSRRSSHGPAYATAMSVLALSVHDGYLPLFQR